MSNFPLVKEPMQDWMQDLWHLYARCDGHDLEVKVGRGDYRVTFRSPLVDERVVLYQGNSMEQAIRTFNKHIGC